MPHCYRLAFWGGRPTPPGLPEDPLLSPLPHVWANLKRVHGCFCGSCFQKLSAPIGKDFSLAIADLIWPLSTRSWYPMKKNPPRKLIIFSPCSYKRVYIHCDQQRGRLGRDPVAVEISTFLLSPHTAERGLRYPFSFNDHI